MNKYINIIIVSFFSVLSAKYPFGLAFFIPIAFFLIINDIKSSFIIVPISLISVYFFSKEYFLVLLLVLALILIYSFLFKNKPSIIYNAIFVFVVCFLSLIIKSNAIILKDVLFFALYTVVSSLIYLYFAYNEISFKYKSRLFTSYSYIEMIMGIASVIGASSLVYNEMNIALFVSFYFAMYLSSSSKGLLSMAYSIICMFFLKIFFKTNEAVFIPFISAIFMLESLYSSLITICLSFILWIFKLEFVPPKVLEVTIFLTLFFEVFRFSLISTKSSKEEVTRGVYESSLEKVNDEIINFASFLDLLAKDYSTSKQYSKKLSLGINELSRRYCDMCYLKEECYKKNKGKKYNYFKDILLLSRREDINITEVNQFYKACPYITDIKKSASLISDNLKMDEESARNNLVISQINGISNVLRQYIVDNSLKKEIAYDYFYKMKEALIDQGLNISVFKVKKALEDDFLIEVGFRNFDFSKLKETVEEIGSFFLKRDVSLSYVQTKKMTTFVNIIPKVLIDIDYGYGGLSVANEAMSGDNYLIKELDGAKLIAAISDGMGKGMEAMDESSQTLKLIDEITTSNLSSSTALQIINTFYYIQEYMEKYSTLDFIEIERTLSEARIYKMGSSTTYVYHKDGSLEKIYNKNLPFGIEEVVEEVKIKLKSDDVIIMASDGIFENIVNEEAFESFIKDIIKETPQKITYEILNYVRNNKVKTKDDMSVITLKVVAN